MTPPVIQRLHEAIAAVCPIDGVSGSQGSVRVDHRPEATQPQRDAAAAVVAAFDWSQAAHDAWLEDRRPERKAVRQAAAQAVADIDAYLLIADAATNAQVRAQVKLLSQIVRRLVRHAATQE